MDQTRRQSRLEEVDHLSPPPRWLTRFVHFNIWDIVVTSDPLAQVRKRYKGRRMIGPITCARSCSGSNSELLQASKSDFFQGSIMPFLTWLSLSQGVVGAL